MQEAIFKCLTNISPSVRHGTVRFIEKLSRTTQIDMLNRITPELVPKLVGLIKDKDQATRDLTFHCIGIIKGRLGDDQMS